jgi:lipid-A-disaccharide synthase-like uncharacterized protein
MILALSSLAWEAIGFLGQGLFTARFLVQWLASERRRESVVPLAFWWLSVCGSAVLVLYAAVLRDPVFLLGNLVNGFIYARNLVLVHAKPDRPTPRRVLIPATLAVGVFALFVAWRGLDRDIPPAWLAAGFLGATCWSGRFVIQWFHSERAGRSVMPRSFWYVGLVGAVLLLTYSVLREKPVFILGYLFAPIPYIRNLVLIYRKEGLPGPLRWATDVWRKRRSRTVAIALLGILLAGFLTTKVLTSSRIAGDFLRYHRAGRIVATGHADRLYDRDYDPYPEEEIRGLRFKYLPAFAVLMAPLGALPPKAAEVLWALLNAFDIILTLAVSWWLCRRYGARAAWMWVPLLFVLRFAWDNVNLGQVNPTIVLAATGGIYLVETGRPARGGLLTALGATIKFTPLILVLVYAVRGKWRAVGFSLLGVLLLAAVVPSAVLGPARAARLTREVWDQQGRHLVVEGRQEDVTGESLRAMTYRLLGSTPLRKLDSKIDVSLDVLTESQALLRYRILALLLLAGLVVFAAIRREDLQAPLVWGAALCTGLLVSPETRQSHFLALALPATVVVMVIARSGLGTVRAKAAGALYLAAFALAALPSRGIVGNEVMVHAAALCAAGFATLLLRVAMGLGSGILRREGEP